MLVTFLDQIAWVLIIFLTVEHRRKRLRFFWYNIESKCSPYTKWSVCEGIRRRYQGSDRKTVEILHQDDFSEEAVVVWLFTTGVVEQNRNDIFFWGKWRLKKSKTFETRLDVSASGIRPPYSIGIGILIWGRFKLYDLFFIYYLLCRVRHTFSQWSFV